MNLRATLSDRNGKPYIVIDNMEEGGKTVFAATVEYIQINNLNKEVIKEKGTGLSLCVPLSKVTNHLKRSTE